MPELLVVVVEDGPGLGLEVASFQGHERDRLLKALGLRDYPNPPAGAFAVITAPTGETAGLSWSAIVERRALS